MKISKSWKLWLLLATGILVLAISLPVFNCHQGIVGAHCHALWQSLH